MGYAVQKKAHLNVRGTNKAVIKTWTWWLGIFFMFVGLPFNMISLLWADQSLLSTIGPFAIVFALILGRYMLKEKIYNRHYIAVTLMILGSMVAMTFASKNTTEYSIDEILERLSSNSSLCTLVINFTLMALFLIVSYRILKDIITIYPYFTDIEKERCLLKMHEKPELSDTNYTLQKDDSNLTEIAKIDTLKALKEEVLVQDPKWLKVAVFALPWFAGFMSGMLGLSAKCGIMLAVHMSENGNSQNPFTYIILGLPPLFVASELSLLNMGLKMFDTCYIIPIFKASIVFHNTMCGGILLQEFFTFKLLHMFMFSVGIFI